LTNAAFLAASQCLPDKTAAKQIRNLELNIATISLQPYIMKMAYCLLNLETVSEADFISIKQNFQFEFKQSPHVERPLETVSKANLINIKPDFQAKINWNPDAERQKAFTFAFKFFRAKLPKMAQCYGTCLQPPRWNVNQLMDC
jgi:hypothetical protein